MGIPNPLVLRSIFREPFSKKLYGGDTLVLGLLGGRMMECENQTLLRKMRVVGSFGMIPFAQGEPTPKPSV